MLKRLTLSICCVFFISVLANRVFAQASADSVHSETLARENIIDNFNTALGPQSRLYNGEGYNGYYPQVTGNAYFLDAADWGNGDIVYDGYTYKNMKISYDIYTDQVIIPLYNSYLKISLNSEKVKSFDVFGHHMIYIKNNPAVTGSVQTGFYDELYGGKIQVLCKRSKSIQQDHSGTSITSYFYPALNYYVLKNNQYFAANSKGNFLDVFKDKKKDLQQFVRENKIKFKKDTKEKDMARVAEYYDHITH